MRRSLRDTTQPASQPTEGDADVRSLHLTRPGWAGPLALVTLALLAPPSTARAQLGTAKPAPVIKLKQPIPFRVHQRDRDEKADIAIEVEPLSAGFDVTVAGASYFALGGSSVEPTKTRFEDGKLLGVPTGGPYVINVDVRVNDSHPSRSRSRTSSSATSGSSPASRTWKAWATWSTSRRRTRRVTLLGMDGKWSQAEEPLHWLVDSPDPVHSGDPATRDEAVGRRSTRTAPRGRGSACRSPSALVERDRRPDRPDRLRARRHEHGAVGPGQEGRGRQEPLRLDAPARSSSPAARSRACSGTRARATPTPRPPRSIPRSSPTSSRPSAPTSISPSCRSTSCRSAGSSARGDPKDWNAVQDAERRLAERVPNTAVVAVDRPGARRPDPRRHPGPEARRAAAGEGRRSASCSARSARPRRPSTA